VGVGVCERGRLRGNPDLSNWAKGWFMTESRQVFKDLSMVPLNYWNGNLI